MHIQLDLLLWPAVQVVNFRYVPASLRVLFQNVFYVVWIMILSYLKHHVSLAVVNSILMNKCYDYCRRLQVDTYGIGKNDAIRMMVG